jgi:replication-associated recombination protein RarA
MINLISEKLRPRDFDELVLDEYYKNKLKKMYESRTVMNMIFYGKPGSGKTSAAKLFTESEYFDSLTINGSLDTSIDIVRNKIVNFATSMSLYQNHKICFIDEADYLSKSSQASLRGVIEETSKNCRYIFTANDMSKIHNALYSRMMPLCFDMSPAQIETEIEKYKIRIISMLKANYENVDEQRILRLIDMNFPDYRTISNKIEFEML